MSEKEINHPDAKKLLRQWINAMTPLAESHPNPKWTDRKYFLLFNESKTGARFDNHDNLTISLDSSVVQEHTEFLYARTVSPYGLDGFADKNLYWASMVSNSVAPAAWGAGFKCRVEGSNDLLTSARKPAIVLAGSGSQNFEAFRKLTFATDALIDFYLVQADKQKIRPLAYAFVPHPNLDSESRLVPISAQNIKDARGIVRTLIPIPEGNQGHYQSNRKDAFSQWDGQVLSVDEFLSVQKKE